MTDEQRTILAKLDYWRDELYSYRVLRDNRGYLTTNDEKAIKTIENTIRRLQKELKETSK
jgi:hypothetical protein